MTRENYTNLENPSPEERIKAHSPHQSQLLQRYKFLNHMTDAEIEAYGSSLEESFENAARALEDTMVDIKTIRPKMESEIVIEAPDKEALLYAWLESLIAKQDTANMLFSEFDCKISKSKNGFKLVAKVRGEKFDPKKHEQKTAIKAPTFHGMKISEEKRQTTMRFLLDL